MGTNLNFFKTYGVRSPERSLLDGITKVTREIENLKGTYPLRERKELLREKISQLKKQYQQMVQRHVDDLNSKRVDVMCLWQAEETERLRKVDLNYLRLQYESKDDKEILDIANRFATRETELFPEEFYTLSKELRMRGITDALANVKESAKLFNTEMKVLNLPEYKVLQDEISVYNRATNEDFYVVEQTTQAGKKVVVPMSFKPLEDELQDDIFSPKTEAERVIENALSVKG